MIQVQLKLRPNQALDAKLDEWQWMLTGVWNWSVRKIENDAQGGIYYTPKDFQNILAEHGKKMGVPSHTVQGILAQAHTAWVRCFKKMGGKPKLKGQRNKLNSIPFPDPVRAPEGNDIKLPGLGKIRFHKQELPAGKIKCGRLAKRASGWSLCVFIDADREPIEGSTGTAVGIDPGFKDLITLSNGEKVNHPKELQESLARLGQAQRGGNKKLVARIHERIKNQRKDRNHKLSLRLVKDYSVIALSKDNVKGMARVYGKSVASSGIAQLRSMLDYKSRAGGVRYLEVNSRNSTRICSACGALTGPEGRAGLKVRQWECIDCGTQHDRDINAAINTLTAAVGTTVEMAVRYAA
jgi:transposase